MESAGVVEETAEAPVIKRPSVAPGNRRYETLVLLHPRFEGEALDALVETVKKIISDAGSVEVESESLGRRRLAYEVAGQMDGIYVAFRFEGAPVVVARIETALRLNQDITRYITTAEEES